MTNLNLYLFLIINLLIFIILIIPSNLSKFHPLNFRLILVIYSIILCLNINFLSRNFWYSYILFLVIIGGLIILFLYFTRIANNELINFNLNFLKYFVKKIILIIFLIILIKIFFLKNIFNLIFTEIFNLNLLLIKINDLNIKYIYIDFYLDLNLYIILYLFLTIIGSILICKKELIPFRQINYYE